MTLALTAVTALVALLVVAGWQWQEARLQRNEAQLQRDKARTELLAIQAHRANAEATSPDDIERAGALALASIKIARQSNRPAEVDSVEAASSALVGLPLAVLTHGGPVRSLAVLADGRLASAGDDGKIRLWPKAGTVVLTHGGPVRSLAVLADGRPASGGGDGNIKIWPKAGTGEPVVLTHGGTVWSLAVLADGRLASAGYDGKIRLWPKEGTGEPVVLTHGNWVHSLAVLADGRLASAGDDGKIKLWPKEGTGEPVVLTQASRVWSLAVLADGRLASGGQDDMIKLWLVDEQKLVAAPVFAPAAIFQRTSGPVTSAPTLPGSRAAVTSLQTGGPQTFKRPVQSCCSAEPKAALTRPAPLFTMRPKSRTGIGGVRSMDTGIIRATEDEALQFHANGRPGKLSIAPTKPLTTQRDLSLAYSPGVAFPCLSIHRQPSAAFDYTSKGNFVAVISNGTAVLGLGDLGALAAKPVMEGKAALFKRFADIDSIDLEIDTRDVDEFVNCVRFLHPAFGGINLEDIKAPECFIIEERLRELLEIPVFHDDQHGTAIIAAAGLINALHLTGRSLDRAKMVINGAGAASIACVELLKTMGLPAQNVVLCDTKGVVYRGRTDGMNQWKSAHAVETKARSLAEAVTGADIFFGLSAKGAVDQAMVASMGEKPIIFAMANPDPEITPEEVRAVRSDAIIATGRSDYPNQVNNVLGFPYIFRGALDVHASTINDAMKIAAAEALARLAREDVPDEVAAAYSGQRLTYGPDYIIPAPFDPRLIWAVPSAVAKAAMDSGVARKPILDMGAYKRALRARLDPTAAGLEQIFERVRAEAKRVVFAEGEEEKTIRAALLFQESGFGAPVLVGREERIKSTMSAMGLSASEGLEIHNARLSQHNKRYADFLYARQQRQGMLYRDCQRLVNQDRNVFAACMVACGDADAMVTGVTRNSFDVLDEVSRVIAVKPDCLLFGLTVLLARERTVLLADTLVHEVPSSAQLADIAIQAAAKAHQLGLEPRVALLSYSNFGNPMGKDVERVRDAVALLDQRGVGFEYDGEMSADVALDEVLMRRLYPFCRLTGPANILVMPELHSANIAAKLLPQLGGGTVVGPLLLGLSHPVQIVNMGATVSDLVNLAALSAHDAIL